VALLLGAQVPQLLRPSPGDPLRANLAPETLRNSTLVGGLVSNACSTTEVQPNSEQPLCKQILRVCGRQQVCDVETRAGTHPDDLLHGMHLHDLQAALPSLPAGADDSLGLLAMR
jgi:hypothetical protein